MLAKSSEGREKPNLVSISLPQKERLAWRKGLSMIYQRSHSCMMDAHAQVEYFKREKYLHCHWWVDVTLENLPATQKISWLSLEEFSADVCSSDGQIKGGKAYKWEGIILVRL